MRNDNGMITKITTRTYKLLNGQQEVIVKEETFNARVEESVWSRIEDEPTSIVLTDFSNTMTEQSIRMI